MEINVLTPVLLSSVFCTFIVHVHIMSTARVRILVPLPSRKANMLNVLEKDSSPRN
jgi:hypothetical protein